MKLFKRILPEIIVFTILSSLFLFKINASYNFDSDFGRDMMWMFDIAHGKITLLGPKTSFGGYYLGPYYYYLFVPLLVVGSMFPSLVITGNAVLSALLMSILFSLMRYRIGNVLALLSILWLSMTPYVLFSARGPGNAFTYVPLMLLIISAFFLHKKLLVSHYFWAGLGMGLMVNFHPVSLLAMVPLVVISVVASKKNMMKKCILFGAGSAILMMPIVLFEAKHGFVMFRNTFIQKSYGVFANPLNPASQMVPSQNPFANLFLIARLADPWILPSAIMIFAVISIAICMVKREKNDIVVALSLFMTIMIYAILLRFQVAFHYLFPLLAMIQLSLIYFVSRIRIRLVGILIIGGCFAWSVIFFPRHFYKPATRDFGTMYARVQMATKRIEIPESDFNIVTIRETPLAILGYEYRYMLRLLGKKSNDEFSYKTASYLLMVSEMGSIDADKQRSWEIDEFGSKELVSIFIDDAYAWYLYKKK